MRLALLENGTAYDAEGNLWWRLHYRSPHWRRVEGPVAIGPELKAQIAAELEAGMRGKLLYRPSDPMLSSTEVLGQRVWEG